MVKFYPTLPISECTKHVFHHPLATMEITLTSETLFSTSCQLVILTRSRLMWQHEQRYSLNGKDDHVFAQSSFSPSEWMD